jgi:Flp pilus assembly CpaE family ATPase
MSSYLGISGRYGIADVMVHKGPIDKNLIRSSSCNYADDFHVLTSSSGRQALYAGEPSYEKLNEVLRACRQAYRYTVVDAPRVPDSVAVDLAAASKLVIIVLQLSVKDIKMAHALIEFLTARGVAARKIVPLANRCRNWGPLVRAEDGRRALGVERIRKIRSDFNRAAGSLNRGLTLAQSAPRSGLRRDLQRLAAAIHAYERNGDDKVLGV